MAVPIGTITKIERYSGGAAARLRVGTKGVSDVPPKRLPRTIVLLECLPVGEGGVSSREEEVPYSPVMRLSFVEAEAVAGRYGMVMANLELRNNAR